MIQEYLRVQRVHKNTASNVLVDHGPVLWFPVSSEEESLTITRQQLGDAETFHRREEHPHG